MLSVLLNSSVPQEWDLVLNPRFISSVEHCEDNMTLLFKVLWSIKLVSALHSTVKAPLLPGHSAHHAGEVAVMLHASGLEQHGLNVLEKTTTGETASHLVLNCNTLGTDFPSSSL